MRRIIFALLLCSAPMPLCAEDMGYVAGWRVLRADNPDLKVCSIYTELDNGLVVNIVRSAHQPELVELQMRSPGWQSLRPGDSPSLAIDFSGDVQPFVGQVPQATVLSVKVPYAYVREAFWKAGGYISPTIRGTKVGTFGIGQGKFAAIVAWTKCLQGFADPFAN